MIFSNNPEACSRLIPVLQVHLNPYQMKSMNIHFSHSIKTHWGSGIFYFNQVMVTGLVRFHVSVALRNDGVVVFYMEAGPGCWQLVQQPELPEWIMDLEEELSRAIMKHTVL
jgi:hypothetical protein